jgi:fused signal recognition particle receptor
VLPRLDSSSPSEVLAVVDAHVGQNSAAQVKVFSEAVNLSGLALAKMDGSARAGVLLAIEQELRVPVKLVGIGEDIDDLDFFDPEQYVAALLPLEDKP